MPEWDAHVRRAMSFEGGDAAHTEDAIAEIAQHLEERYRQALSEGASEEEARRRALDELTEEPALAEQLAGVQRPRATRFIHEKIGGGVMNGTWQDWRYAFRMLRRDRWFTALAIVILALGIGANGAIFSVVHAVLLRELPYAEPDELVMVWESRPAEGVDDNVVSPADFLDWRARQQVFDGIAALSSTRLSLAVSGRPELVGVGRVSASFFRVLGVAPVLGRDFRDDEERAASNRVVILNHGFWQRRFGGDPNIVGTRVTIEDQPHQVIGVLPSSFPFTTDAIDLWRPIDFTAEDNRERFNHFLTVYARLTEGVTVERAQQEMDRISAQLQSEVELQNQGHGARVIPLREQLVGHAEAPLLVLMTAVVLILLIACVNIANLLLVRGASRGREVAVRAALGAGRARIVRQLVVECVLLAGVATVVAVPLAMWGASALKSYIPAEIPRLNDAGLNPVVVGFMATAALVTAVLFGLAPAFQTSAVNLTGALKEGGISAVSPHRVRRALVVGEIALAFVLLAGAGLMLRTLVNLVNVDPGFDTENVLTAPISPAGEANVSAESRAVFYRELLDTLQAQPGVAAVGFTSHVPMSGDDSRIGIGIEGEQPEIDGPVRAHWRVVTPGYFDAMQIRLLQGRLPIDTETGNRAPVAVINRTAAERYWPGVDPIGRRLRVLTPEWRQIIGIIDDVRHWGPSEAVNPEVYLPGFRTPTNLVVRGTQSSLALTGMVREGVARVSPEAALTRIQMMDDIRGRTFASPRFYLVLLGLFASVGLILAVIGVYGVMAYTVVERRVDIGIRMAIGAGHADVTRRFVGEGVVLTGVGLMLGAVGAFVLTRVMASLLFGVTPTDAPTFAGTALLIGVVALTACYVPARRAANVDPVTVLRQS